MRISIAVHALAILTLAVLPVPAQVRAVFAADAPRAPAKSDDIGAAERAQFAPRLGKVCKTTATRNFLLVHPDDEEWAAWTGRVLEWTHSHFYRSFREAGFELEDLRAPLVWVCFDSREGFDDYALEVDRMDMSWLNAYYSSRSNRVVMVRPPPPDAHRQAGQPVGRDVVFEVAPLIPEDRGRFEDLTRTTHEAAHQLAFNSGLQKRGVMYPLWVSEGLATNFELNEGGNLTLCQPNPVRLRQLVENRAKERLVLLDEFVTAARVPAGDGEAARMFYAQAWGLFRCLQSERPEKLKRYLASLRKLEPGRRAPATMRREFIDAFGSIEDIEECWDAFLGKMEAPVSGR